MLPRVPGAMLGALALTGCGVANAPDAPRAPGSPEAPAAELAPTPASARQVPPPAPVPMGWCAEWLDEAPGEDGATEAKLPVLRMSHLLTGRVVLAGTGIPPLPCAYLSKHAANVDESDLPDPSWVQIRERDSGRELVLAVSLSGASLPSKTGTSLIVEELLDRTAAPVGYLMVRDAAGKPLLWMATDQDLDALRHPPGLSLKRGEHAAGSAWECGIWAAYTIDVAAEDLAGTVPYGGSLQLGDRTIFHGGLLRDVMVDRCVAGTMAEVWVAIAWPRPEPAPSGEPKRPTRR